MELQERDFKVLKALENWGVMGLGQVDGLLFRKDVPGEERARLFFNDIRREDYWGRAYKRLSGLEKMGLVRVQRSDYTWPVYLLTGRGFDLLRQRGQTQFATPSQGVSERLVRHEIAAVGVGLVITQMVGLGVSSARTTWNWLGQRRQGNDSRGNMPDFLVGPSRGKVEHILEVELTPKSPQRYAEILRSHDRRLPDHRTSRLLYIVGWPGGVQHMMRLGRKLEIASLQAAHIADFRAKLGLCEFAPSYYPELPYVLGTRFPTVEERERTEREEAAV